jgi:hypothetical protein
MLVKVHPLRQSGQRLPAGEMRSGPAHVGWIRLYRDPGSPLDRSVRVAVLQLPDGRLLELYDAQLIQWDGRGMILSGEERTLAPGARRLERHRQAWWCKPIDTRDAVAMPPAAQPPLLLEDETESDWIDSLD